MAPPAPPALPTRAASPGRRLDVMGQSDGRALCKLSISCWHRSASALTSALRAASNAVSHSIRAHTSYLCAAAAWSLALSAADLVVTAELRLADAGALCLGVSVATGAVRALFAIR